MANKPLTKAQLIGALADKTVSSAPQVAATASGGAKRSGRPGCPPPTPVPRRVPTRAPTSLEDGSEPPPAGEAPYGAPVTSTSGEARLLPLIPGLYRAAEALV